MAILFVWLGPLVLLTGELLPVALRCGTMPVHADRRRLWCVLALLSWLVPQGIWTQVLTLPVDSPATLLHLVSSLLGALVGLGLLVRHTDPYQVMLAPIPMWTSLNSIVHPWCHGSTDTPGVIIQTRESRVHTGHHGDIILNGCPPAAVTRPEEG